MPTGTLDQAQPFLLPGGCSPGQLARWSDFKVSQVAFGAGDIKQLVSRNPRRHGMVFQVDPAITGGLAFLPQTFSTSTATVLPRLTGFIFLTCDLWKASLLSDWFGSALQAGTVTVIDLFDL